MKADEISKAIDSLTRTIDMLTETRKELVSMLNNDDTYDIKNLATMDAIQYAHKNNIPMRELIKDMYSAGLPRVYTGNTIGVLFWMLLVCTGVDKIVFTEKVLGISESSFMNVISSEATVRTEDLQKLSNVLGISPNTFMELVVRRYPYITAVTYFDPILRHVLKDNKWIVDRIPGDIYWQFMDGLQ